MMNDQEQRGIQSHALSSAGFNQSLTGANQTVNIKNAIGSSHIDDLEAKNAKDAHMKRLKEKAEQENSNLWQHPYVDVLKHFKILPGSDWKLNRKQGDVQEYFAKEIGRRALSIEGTISANNFIQVPNPAGTIKALGLNGRYIYLQVKCPKNGLPFSYHLDLGMAERSHGIRISISNLFKNFNTSNGFVAQVPLELLTNQWTVVVLDLYDILKKSQILPQTYLIEGSYQIRSINVCANTHLRGIYTSDNLYDFVTLPADMRFKFAFDLGKWPEYFSWQTLPQDWQKRKGRKGELPGDENMNLNNIINQQQSTPKLTREEQRRQMRQEIDQMMGHTGQEVVEEEEDPHENREILKKQKYDDMQRQLSMKFEKGPSDHPVTGYVLQDDEKETKFGRQQTNMSSNYRGGQFSGTELSRSNKLNKDPIMELKHIIGYQADKCLNIKWSKKVGENIVLFTSGGTLIAMDSETNQQTRFFFGHSAPISCFDLSYSGDILASAQEGKNSIIRMWDYATARCITMVTMPVTSLKCLSFSYDGRYLVSVGKIALNKEHNKELITIWDISNIQRGGKPEIVAKQTSEFNIISIKFSPIDSNRLVSCGKENIRFWRIRDTGNIRGSAVVLNHFARDTVFTCLDYEYGFRSADKNENEALKRVFVGTKHGMVFQINYQTEALEAQYKTNDAAIYSIAVNDAFCVTGSEDTYLRVWPLDFQEFFMEAQHEGTVSAVDISSDGLKVVCGTLYGSIGILDKSNQNYKTLLRSHTDNILHMDFHKIQNTIITVSQDKTIRLWSVETLDEVYEFSSPEDQPLCVSAHPSRPIFACGFESGKMRIFDIDTTEVLDEFSQFNKPLISLKYDNSGKVLVTCCKDGSVSIHNAARQHLPIKMMHLELPPEFVHVAFTERTITDPDNLLQRFAVMGEYGNNVIIYDTDSFMIQHQININHNVKSFKFANDNRDLLVVTKDCKIRFYSLMKYEGIFLREVANCHRGAINGLDVTSNSGYMLTGGEDNMVKIWDYEAQKTIPFYFQSFIGHTYPITSICFNPKNNNQIFSTGERDGIFIWEFNGDVENDYKMSGLAGQDKESLSTLEKHNEEGAQSALERIRMTNKAKKAFRNQMSEDSFIIPTFAPLEQCQIEMNHKDFEHYGTPIVVKQRRLDRKLTYNHYADCSKRVEVEGVSGFINSFGGESRQSILEQKLINGYDGFGGVHDNLIWNVERGFTYFTLNNKLIIENTKTREQTVFADSTVQYSCMATTPDYKIIAVGQGYPNDQGSAEVILYDTEKRRKMTTKHSCHMKGVQSMAFSNCANFLITVGVQGEDNLAVFNLSSMQSYNPTQTEYKQYNTFNMVKVDPFVRDGKQIRFVTCGNKGTIKTWIYDIEGESFECQDCIDSNQHLDFLSIEFTDQLPAPASTYWAVIGASDGSLQAYDINQNRMAEIGNQSSFVNGQIGGISIKNNTVVIASSNGTVHHYPINGTAIQPDDIDMINTEHLDSACVAFWMDFDNIEGLFGTEAGSIYYINFIDKIKIKLVNSNNINQSAITYCQFDPQNDQLFLTNSGIKSGECKIYANINCDLVMNQQNNFEDDGYVVFVISTIDTKYKKKRRLIGFSNGVVKRFSLDSLAIEHVFKVPLNLGEKLTCGYYSENQYNFALGTNQGTVFIGSIKQATKKTVIANYCRIDNIGRCNSFDDSKAQKFTATNQTYQEQEKRTSGPIRLINTSIVDDNGLISQDDIQLERQGSLEDMGMANVTGITSIHFPSFDPIGTMVIAFDDGTIKLWQSTVKNEQHFKILELQQMEKNKGAQKAGNKPVQYDISEVGYQQFDMMDSFDIFENPHDVEEITEEDRVQLKNLYSGKKYPSCQATFAPGNTLTDQYICYVDALQYIFIRNYARHQIIKRISLSLFPTCLNLFDFSRFKLDEHSAYLPYKNKGNYLFTIGTKEGKVLCYRYSQTSCNKILQTKTGISFGAISSVTLSDKGESLIAANETGEIMQFELFKKLNEE